MIHDVDESLRTLLDREVLNGAGVDISFEAPTRDWSSRRSNPALNLYLYDIREDLQRRPVQFEEKRDAEGIVTKRTVPPRRFRLAYLITAWTQRPEDEHRLLSATLSCFVAFDAIPADVLQGALRDSPVALRTTIALPLPAERSISDVWSALGGELKASLDLVVTVPFVTSRFMEVGPPVTEDPFVRVSSVEGRRLEDTVRRRASGGEGGGGGAAEAEGGATGAPGDQPVREIVERGKIKVGRRIEVISMPKP